MRLKLYHISKFTFFIKYLNVNDRRFKLNLFFNRLFKSINDGAYLAESGSEFQSFDAEHEKEPS